MYSIVTKDGSGERSEENENYRPEQKDRGDTSDEAATAVSKLPLVIRKLCQNAHAFFVDASEFYVFGWQNVYAFSLFIGESFSIYTHIFAINSRFMVRID